MGSGRRTTPIDGLRRRRIEPRHDRNDREGPAKAKYQSQLTPDPDHDFAPVDLQIFNGGDVPNMQGFIASYFSKQRNVEHSRNDHVLLRAREAAGADDAGA